MWNIICQAMKNTDEQVILVKDFWIYLKEVMILWAIAFICYPETKIHLKEKNSKRVFITALSKVTLDKYNHVISSTCQGMLLAFFWIVPQCLDSISACIGYWRFIYELISYFACIHAFVLYTFEILLNILFEILFERLFVISSSGATFSNFSLWYHQ